LSLPICFDLANIFCPVQRSKVDAAADSSVPADKEEKEKKEEEKGEDKAAAAADV
jgi:hypothetical protein